ERKVRNGRAATNEYRALGKSKEALSNSTTPGSSRICSSNDSAEHDDSVSLIQGRISGAQSSDRQSAALNAQRAGETRLGLQRADEGQVQSLRLEEVARGGADFRGGDLGEAGLDFVGRNDLAVAQELFAQPHHLAFGVFQAQVDLADDIVTGAPQFGGGGGRRVQPPKSARDRLEGLHMVVVSSSGGDHQSPLL